MIWNLLQILYWTRRHFLNLWTCMRILLWKVRQSPRLGLSLVPFWIFHCWEFVWPPTGQVYFFSSSPLHLFTSISPNNPKFVFLVGCSVWKLASFRVKIAWGRRYSWPIDSFPSDGFLKYRRPFPWIIPASLEHFLTNRVPPFLPFSTIVVFSSMFA